MGKGQLGRPGSLTKGVAPVPPSPPSPPKPAPMRTASGKASGTYRVQPIQQVKTFSPKPSKSGGKKAK